MASQSNQNEDGNTDQIDTVAIPNTIAIIHERIDSHP